MSQLNITQLLGISNRYLKDLESVQNPQSRTFAKHWAIPKFSPWTAWSSIFQYFQYPYYDPYITFWILLDLFKCWNVVKLQLQASICNWLQPSRWHVLALFLSSVELRWTQRLRSFSHGGDTWSEAGTNHGYSIWPGKPRTWARAGHSTGAASCSGGVFQPWYMIAYDSHMGGTWESFLPI